MKKLRDALDTTNANPSMGTSGCYRTSRALTPEEKLEMARINDEGSAALTKRMKIAGSLHEDATPDVLEEMEDAMFMRVMMDDGGITE